MQSIEGMCMMRQSSRGPLSADDSVDSVGQSNWGCDGKAGSAGARGCTSLRLSRPGRHSVPAA